MKQFTKKQAIAIFKSGDWKDWTEEEIVKTQLFQDRLCVPFDVFHKAIESVFDRSVWTHEFGLNRQGLIAEYLELFPSPTFQDILDLLPK